jgi:hypothetical protein
MSYQWEKCRSRKILSGDPDAMKAVKKSKNLKVNDDDAAKEPISMS